MTAVSYLLQESDNKCEFMVPAHVVTELLLLNVPFPFYSLWTNMARLNNALIHVKLIRHVVAYLFSLRLSAS